VRDRIRQQASAAAQYAGEVGQDMAGRISSAVQSGLEQTLDAGSNATARVSDAAERAVAEVSAAANRLPAEKIEQARDQALLGAAAISVTAAVAVVMARNKKLEEV